MMNESKFERYMLRGMIEKEAPGIGASFYGLIQLTGRMWYEELGCEQNMNIFILLLHFGIIALYSKRTGLLLRASL
ncbi:hypothetical protein BBG47_15140 [Paenibacillus sp. KS1]|nr:hypothetical protein BBG47_15140 [Paenibacillus sp. KS1]